MIQPRVLIATTLGLSLLCSTAMAEKATLDAKLVESAKKSVDKGLHFLRYKQEENGSYGQHVGLTALVLLAFTGSHRGYEASDGPFVGRGAD